MKALPVLLAATLALPVVATAAPVPSAFDQTEPAAPDAPAPWLVDSTPSPSALALDGSFVGPYQSNNPAGMAYYDGNSGNDVTEYGLRTFLSRDGGYAYVVGLHVHADGGNDAFIVRINANGSYDTSFGANGKRFVSVPFPIVAVAMDPSGLFYFTGPIVTPPFTDADIAVYCMDDGGTPCDGFGINGLVKKPIDINGLHDDEPTGIVCDVLGSVFVYGWTNTAASGENADLFVAKFSSTTGAVASGFGTHNGVAVYGFDYAANGSDGPNAALLTYPASPTGAYRLYVAGDTQTPAGWDAFVIALNPSTGAYDTAFHNGPVIVHVDDPGDPMDDNTFTAMTELHDGHLLLAGYGRDANAHYRLLLAKLNASGGGKDATFCGGGWCVNSLTVGSGITSFPLSHYEWPNAVAERPGNHDLVFAMTMKNDVFSGSDGHVFQEAVEIGPRGNGLRAYTALDYDATSTPRDSYPRAILVDDSHRVLVTGTRWWNSATFDYDMTVARMIDTDTIFVSGFEAGQ